MAAFLAWTKRVVGLAVTAAAVVGWTVVILQDTWLNNLENKLAAAKQESMRASDNKRPAARQTEVETDKKALVTSKAALASLQSEIDAAETELARLQTTLHRQGQSSQAPAATYQTLTRARVRAGPSINTNEVAVVSAQQVLEVSQPLEGDTWYKVRVSGYMFHKLVQPMPEQ